jgi:hypothetical protein
MSKRKEMKPATWEEMLEIEAKHPFFAGNLLSQQAWVESDAIKHRVRQKKSRRISDLKAA